MRSSALAGACGALGGTFGKLAADGSTSFLDIVVDQCTTLASATAISVSCDTIAAITRVACVGLMLASNAVMLRFFVNGLHETDSLTATVTSSASNFILSAASGYILFQEPLPAQWFVGATAILVGVAFLLHGDSDPTAEEEIKKQQ